MAVKNFSSRVAICGRGSKCGGGHSAVEQSAYIGREKMYNEYDGQTYYPKYSEDLVHTEVLLPDNAPKEYIEPKVLWNAVEMSERSSNAQLARTLRFSLPNEWSYDLATKVVEDLCQDIFVTKGMCVQFAIHDSENRKSGQRNLHVHLMATLRGVDEQGNWMPKQKKVYLTDENGERIPLIDKATGLQKVDKQNRKQWKCKTIPTNDWSGKENAKLWRKQIVEIINDVNRKMGMTENTWEHRSFKEQGLDIMPQIHLGEKASALERAGIRTIRGNINREIIASNMLIDAARAAYEQAKETFEAVKAIPVKFVETVKNEIIEMIHEVAKRSSNRLRLPIVGTKYLREISDRATLQKKDWMEGFVRENGWTKYGEMMADKVLLDEEYDGLAERRKEMTERMSYLEGLLDDYKLYEPYIKNHKELWALKGFSRKKYERQHMGELYRYDFYRAKIKDAIVEDDKKITPSRWRRELADLKAAYNNTQKPYARTVWKLAAISVLIHNKKDLERMLENERGRQQRSYEKHRNNVR